MYSQMPVTFSLPEESLAYCLIQKIPDTKLEVETDRFDQFQAELFHIIYEELIQEPVPFVSIQE